MKPILTILLREIKKRWMLLWDEKKRSLVLMEFDREKALACLARGQSVIPLWLDKIHQQLLQKLELKEKLELK